jgi:prepilin-type N-terminal cleavage/methylation domain-containing protein
VNTTKGFSLLELVVVLVILGILGTIVMPNLGRLKPGYEHDQFTSNIRMLVRRAWQESLLNHQLHRIYFDLEKQIVRIDKETNKKTGTGGIAYEQLEGVYMPSAYQWPATMQMKDFFVDGQDIFHVKGVRITEVWFPIFADGTTQHIIMNWFDQADTRESDAGSGFSISISPFIAKVTETNGFQKPA